MRALNMILCDFRMQGLEVGVSESKREVRVRVQVFKRDVAVVFLVLNIAGMVDAS